jgi:hypothetical protein
MHALSRREKFAATSAAKNASLSAILDLAHATLGWKTPHAAHLLECMQLLIAKFAIFDVKQ